LPPVTVPDFFGSESAARDLAIFIVDGMSRCFRDTFIFSSAALLSLAAPIFRFRFPRRHRRATTFKIRFAELLNRCEAGIYQPPEY